MTSTTSALRAESEVKGEGLKAKSRLPSPIQARAELRALSVCGEFEPVWGSLESV